MRMISFLVGLMVLAIGLRLPMACPARAGDDVARQRRLGTGNAVQPHVRPKDGRDR
jgi:hypothetical protein